MLKKMGGEVGLRTAGKQLKKGLLPAPFGPMMAHTSSRVTSKLTLESAARPPNRTVNSSVLSTGADAAARPFAGERTTWTASTLTYATGKLQAGGTIVFSFGTISSSWN